MDTFTMWCAFVGAWLLVAGPLYQAALELREEDIQVERVHAVRKSLPVPSKVSVWWWLLPPIKIVLERRRRRAYQRAHLNALSPEDLSAMVSFMSKAVAWMFVAGGGLLLATRETYELINAYDQPLWLFWFVLAFLIMTCISNVIIQVSRAKQILKR